MSTPIPAAPTPLDPRPHPKGPDPSHFLPEIVLGFIINILAAVAYDLLKQQVAPTALIGSLVLIVTLLQVYLIRHASRKADEYWRQALDDAKLQARQEAQDELKTLRARAVDIDIQLSEAIRQRGIAIHDLDAFKAQEPVTQAELRKLRSEILHNFIHRARDLGIKLMPKSRIARVPSPDLVYRYARDLTELLQSISTLFNELAPPGTKVWVALRVRHKNGSFHTALRTSDCDPKREQRSEPLLKDYKIISTLEATYGNQHHADCVLLTGPGKPEWQHLKNDDLNENKSVLLGAVFTKYWGRGGFAQPVLGWLLCVNADRSDAFDDSHKPLMRCCNDVFSWILNELARCEEQEND